MGLEMTQNYLIRHNESTTSNLLQTTLNPGVMVESRPDHRTMLLNQDESGADELKFTMQLRDEPKVNGSLFKNEVRSSYKHIKGSKPGSRSKVSRQSASVRSS